MLRQWNTMLLAHLGAFFWDCPNGFVEIKFCPLRQTQFTRTHSQKSKELQSNLHLPMSGILINRPEQFSKALGVRDARLILDLSSDNNTFQGWCWVIFGQSLDHSHAHHFRNQHPHTMRCFNRSTAFNCLDEVKDMGGFNLFNWTFGKGGYLMLDDPSSCVWLCVLLINFRGLLNVHAQWQTRNWSG